MKVNAPERIYIPRLISDGKLIHEWSDVPFKKFRFFFDKEIAENIEYIRKDAFIERACDYLMEYEFNDSPTIADRRKRVEDFKKYMED